MRLRATTLLLVPGLLISASACQSRLEDKPTAEVTMDVDGRTDSSTRAPAQSNPGTATVSTALVALPESRIDFVGSKLTMDQPGSFQRFSATATVDAGVLRQLDVTVETDSITAAKDKLTRHLKDEDFLAADQFPEATFRSESIQARADGAATHEVVGAMTIRGTTKTLSFPATIESSGGQLHARASFKFNRRHFGMQYDGMADDAIKDEVLLEIDLVFSAS
jgi:polyisoprenoid-binding protein YceI